jgi:hypothetical protein
MLLVLHLEPGMRLLEQRDSEDFFRDAPSWLTRGEARGERDRRREEVEREAFVYRRYESRWDDLSCVVDSSSGQ